MKFKNEIITFKSGIIIIFLIIIEVSFSLEAEAIFLVTGTF